MSIRKLLEGDVRELLLKHKLYEGSVPVSSRYKNEIVKFIKKYKKFDPPIYSIEDSAGYVQINLNVPAMNPGVHFNDDLGGLIDDICNLSGDGVLVTGNDGSNMTFK